MSQIKESDAQRAILLASEECGKFSVTLGICRLKHSNKTTAFKKVPTKGMGHCVRTRRDPKQNKLDCEREREKKGRERRRRKKEYFRILTE